MALRECIIHFKLIEGQQTKQLRALNFIPDDRQPNINDFVTAFAQLGYNVKLIDEKELIFAPINIKETYKLDITKIEVKGDKNKPYYDLELKGVIDAIRGSKW